LIETLNESVDLGCDVSTSPPVNFSTNKFNLIFPPTWKHFFSTPRYFFLIFFKPPNSIVNAIDHIMNMNRPPLEEKNVGEDDWVVVSQPTDEEINSTLRNMSHVNTCHLPY
jgi:hypothetical protein